MLSSFLLVQLILDSFLMGEIEVDKELDDVHKDIFPWDFHGIDCFVEFIIITKENKERREFSMCMHLAKLVGIDIQILFIKYVHVIRNRSYLRVRGVVGIDADIIHSCIKKGVFYS